MTQVGPLRFSMRDEAIILAGKCGWVPPLKSGQVLPDGFREMAATQLESVIQLVGRRRIERERARRRFWTILWSGVTDRRIERVEPSAVSLVIGGGQGISVAWRGANPELDELLDEWGRSRRARVGEVRDLVVR